MKTGIKTKGFILCIVISLFALVGSSIWEGAAGVGGSLPGNGLYIATNSFPLNTVVDIINLENGQTVRVVTSSALEAAPGLLAMLSRDAAEAIGLQGSTLGRIRMHQPPDPVAFSRFGSGRRRHSPPGDPDFDPAAFAALHGLYPLADDGADALNRRIEGGDVIVDLDAAEAYAAPVPAAPPAVQYVDIIPEAETHIAEAHQAEAHQEAYRNEETYIAAAPVPVDAAAAEAEAAEQEIEAQELAEAMDEAADQRFHQDAVSLMRGFFPEPSFEVVDDVFGAPLAQDEPEVLAEAEPQAVEPVAIAEDPGYVALTLVPAELRPPVKETAVVPDPDYIIPGIERPPVAAFRDGYPDPSMVIEPIVEAPLEEAPPAEDPLAMLPVYDPAIPEPAEQLYVAAFVPPPVFPLPMISNLQAGKYYLQIAAYSNAEAVRYELSRIDRIDSNLAREVVVLRGVNPEHGAVYQILIGPLNLGESGALLHRFRSTHRDAFIRSGS